MEGKYSSIELHPLPPSSLKPPDLDDDDDRLPLVAPAAAAAAPAGGSDVASAVFNLATSVIGAGIMALPAATRVLGAALGLAAVVLMGLLSELSIELLVRFAAPRAAASYGDAVHAALGRPARLAAELCVVVNTAGVLVVYLIIIGEVVSGSPRHAGVLDQLLGPGGAWDRRGLVILAVLVLFLAPLCLLERIGSLGATSAASVALAVVFVIVSCAIALIKIADGSVRVPRMGPDFGSKEAMLDLLVVIPIMANAYVCHFNVQPIYNELEGRSPEKMNRVSRITSVLCVAVYASTAISGYLLFGEDTESDVLTNFDRDLGIRYSSVLNYVVRIGYVLHLILVFPVIHFSLRQTVGEMVFGASVSIGRKKMVALTVVLLALIYLGSTMIPNIWVAFKFTGATTGLSLGFIFPALIALRSDDAGEKLSYGLKVLCWMMLVMAGIVSIIGVIGNVYSLSRHESE